MNLKDSHFSYTALLKNEQDIDFEALTLFPGLNEISFQSRTFPTYSDCVKSCKGLMEDMSREVNASIKEQRFKVGAEVNPAHSGAPTLSKDWSETEVARFWVYNRTMEGTGGAIAAICRGSIFAAPRVERADPSN